MFTRVPKYEQLTSVGKELYHFEKGGYNATDRLGADSLKTWAKLHGDYASVMFGRMRGTIEDMTGYVFVTYLFVFFFS